MRKSKRLLQLILVCLYLFLYWPLAVVVIHSFNQNAHGLQWGGFTMDWYWKLWRDDAAMHSAWNSLLLAASSTMIATILGTALALALRRHEFPGKRFCQGILYLPVVLPEVVMGVALMMFYALARQWIGLFDLGLTTMVVAHVTFQIPFVALVVGARLAGFDPSLEEAARDLGASPGRTFWRVTLPLLWPGIAAGAMLAFTLSLDDFVVSFFTTGPGATTLPILIYSSVKRGITPEINALSTLMILLSIVVTLLIMRVQRSRA